MGIVEGIGWIAMAWASHTAIPISNMVDRYNNHFAMQVDRGESCFDRVSGIEGHYGGPHEFSMDLICNYRLKKRVVTEDVTKWSLERS